MDEQLHIAIDCSNISSDGAVALNDGLIKEIISFHPNLTKMFIFCNYEYTPSVSDVHFEIIRINRTNRFFHFLWYLFVLDKILRRKNCNKLYLLGGYYLGSFRPYNAIFQNLLPFETKIVNSYPFVMRMKLLLLKRFYKYSYTNALRPYFLTKHSIHYFEKLTALVQQPRFISIKISLKLQYQQTTISNCSNLRFIYVANLTNYKNHIRLIQAFSAVYKTNPEIKLTLIGKMIGRHSKQILKDIYNINSAKDFLSYDGYIPRERISGYYESHSCLIYPSLVESLGVPLYEAILYDLPILCSNKIAIVPIVELGSNHVSKYGKFGYIDELNDKNNSYNNVEYFDPYSVDSICNSIHVKNQIIPQVQDHIIPHLKCKDTDFIFS